MFLVVLVVRDFEKNSEIPGCNGYHRCSSGHSQEALKILDLHGIIHNHFCISIGSGDTSNIL